MFKKSLILLVAILMILPLVSSVPPITTEFIGTEGFEVLANVQDYYKINEGAEVHIFVFNKSNGAIMNGSLVSCAVELTNHNGTVVLEGVATASDDHFHMSRPPNIVDTAEIYGLTIVCNDSVMAGYKTAFFEANTYGVGLTESSSLNFNFAMIFLMILFLSALIGTFKIEHYVGKFVCYWISHILFVVGTFSVWQFNDGFNLAYVGLAGIFKVLFYVSTIAVFPMVILSLAWIFWIHTVTDEMKGMMEKGMTSEEAWSRKSNKGWFGL